VILVVSREGEGQMARDLESRGRIQGLPTLRMDPTVNLDSDQV
jgi:hypothetical protein